MYFKLGSITIDLTDVLKCEKVDRSIMPWIEVPEIFISFRSPGTPSVTINYASSEVRDEKFNMLLKEVMMHRSYWSED